MVTLKEVKEKCKFKDLETHWRTKLLRKYSIYLTWVLVQTSINANQVTLLMFLFGLLSAGFFMMGGYFYNLLAIFFLHFSILLDYCDGAVARYRNTLSAKGYYYDLMHHIIVNPLIIFAIGIGAYFNNPFPIPSSIFLILGFVGMYGMFMDNFVKLKRYEAYILLQRFEEVKKLESKVLKHPDGKNLKVEIKDFFKIKIFNIMFFAAIFNLLHYLVFIYAVLTPWSAFKSFNSWRNRGD